MAITLNGSGTVSGISVGGLPDGIIQSADFAAGVGGKILQFQSVTKTDTASLTGPQSTPQDISGLSISITPASSSSKFYITGKVMLSSTYATTGSIHIDVNGTEVGKADAAGSRPIAHTTGVGYADINSHNQYGSYSAAVDFLVNASNGSAHTIKLQISQPDGARIVYVNRTTTSNDDAAGPRYVSTLTVMEIGV